ncbi:MAG TPA: CidA/LrgA family holin-like protein [Bacillus sp. (in: firmicutes)]|nr:CidA/LrgA family holin-like protein [Bacillus sp. (in: firmicutes)]
MKWLAFTLQVGVLYVFSWSGEWIQKALHLSIPGSLIGMLLLFILISSGLLPIGWFELSAEKLLAFLPLFVIPSTTGVMDYGSFLLGKGSVMLFIVIISTFITMAVSAYVSQWLSAAKKKRARLDEA